MLEHMFEHRMAKLDAAHARLGRAHAEMLSEIARLEQFDAREEGARDVAHLLCIRYGLSDWKAQRWLHAAHALERLPLLRSALARGELGIDKVVELARFARPEDEERLILWAQRISCGAIRRRGDLEVKASLDEAADAHRGRSLGWWYFDEGRRFGLEAELPAADGAIVARALERLARTIPRMPGEADEVFAQARRADALVALCSGAASRGGEGGRPTVVIHAQAQGLEHGTGGSEIENGPVIHPETARRLICDASVQHVLEDRSGSVLRLGRGTREPSVAMVRQIRYRDRECRFPGCGARRFTEVHHIVWWRNGGRTDLENLALICSFHHRLVHELGWSMRREADGTLGWFRPSGVRYRAGPSAGEAAEPSTAPG